MLHNSFILSLSILEAMSFIIIVLAVSGLPVNKILNFTILFSIHLI